MDVPEAQKIITLIIEQHRKYSTDFGSLEQMANDASALRSLEAGVDQFVPGRPGQLEGLNKLKELVLRLGKGLRAHFSFEELNLPAVVLEFGDDAALKSLRVILHEHNNLRERIDQAEKLASELAKETQSRHIWQATANDMRAHVTYTKKLVLDHAEMEQKLFHKLDARLKTA